MIRLLSKAFVFGILNLKKNNKNPHLVIQELNQVRANLISHEVEILIYNTNNVGNMTEKTTLVRIDSSIYLRLQEYLKGKVPFKSASSFIGELVVNALNSDAQDRHSDKKRTEDV